MGFSAQVVCDSIAAGVRLTTMVVTFPRIILAEFNTHRMFSRNSASSRAIPVERRIEQVLREPFVPAAFASNKPGMQAGQDFDEEDNATCREDWLTAMHAAVNYASALSQMGAHKQWANRLLEPFAWHTVVVSATEWANFWALRCHPDAQPEMQTIARMMRAAYDASEPQVCGIDHWHLPFVDPDENLDSALAARVSVARAAAVSYERHLRQDVEADIARHDRLLASGHMSPFEHVAQVVTRRWPTAPSNFARPWLQYRKMLPGEAVFGGGAS